MALIFQLALNKFLIHVCFLWESFGGNIFKNYVAYNTMSCHLFKPILFLEVFLVNILSVISNKRTKTFSDASIIKNIAKT